VTELVGEGTDTVIAAINYAIAPGSSIQFLTAGGTGGLTLVGNELANTIKGSLGNDALTGGSGSDVLIGEAGSDMLTGGTGADTFRFAAVADSTTIIGVRDTVLDFSSAAGDKIDLHLIDANTTVAGDQAFVFIGLNGFSGKLGEVRFAPSGADTLISADLTGDKQADFSVLVSGAHTFSSVDFLL
jgi:Ca2+-binding RTX toxin-like protein